MFFFFDVTDLEKQILVLIDCKINACRGSIQNTRLLSIFSDPSFVFSKNGRGLILAYPQRIVKIIYYLYSKDGFTYSHSIQYKMLLVRLHVCRSIKT